MTQIMGNQNSVTLTRDQSIQDVKRAINEIESAIEDIQFHEDLFEDDQWFFDWVAGMEKRAKVLKTAVENLEAKKG